MRYEGIIKTSLRLARMHVARRGDVFSESIYVSFSPIESERIERSPLSLNFHAGVLIFGWPLIGFCYTNSRALCKCICTWREVGWDYPGSKCLLDLTLFQRLQWSSTEAHRELCYLKGRSDDECQNYVRVFGRQGPDRFLVCGTNAYKPLCRQFTIKVSS